MDPKEITRTRIVSEKRYVDKAKDKLERFELMMTVTDMRRVALWSLLSFYSLTTSFWTYTKLWILVLITETLSTVSGPKMEPCDRLELVKVSQKITLELRYT